MRTSQWRQDEVHAHSCATGGNLAHSLSSGTYSFRARSNSREDWKKTHEHMKRGSPGKEEEEEEGEEEEEEDDLGVEGRSWRAGS